VESAIPLAEGLVLRELSTVTGAYDRFQQALLQENRADTAQEHLALALDHFLGGWHFPGSPISAKLVAAP
jgi:hypothetical protein